MQEQLRSAREERGWSQQQAARRLGVTQAYVSMLEKGRRSAAPLARRLMQVYAMDSTIVPPSLDFERQSFEAERFAHDLSALDYPGFAYLKSRRAKRNPGELVLLALRQNEVEPRLVEALPWLLLRFWRMDRAWLVEKARTHNLQNRLGFTLDLAMAAARDQGNANPSRDNSLSNLQRLLEESRLVREDTFLEPLRSGAEREWVKQNRWERAQHWNLLTSWRPEHVPHVA